MKTVAELNETAIENAKGEIRARNGRNGYLRDFIPAREKALRMAHTIAENRSKPNWETYVTNAEFHLRRTHESITENETIVRSLLKAIEVLSSGELSRTLEPLDVVEAREADARDLISLYIGKYSVTQKSHIKYRYNL